MESLVFLVSVGAFILIIVSIFKKARAERAREIRLLLEYGFSGVPQPEQAIFDLVAERHHGERRQIRIKDVFCRSRADGRIYLFTAVTGGSSNTAGQKSVAVVSAYLDLPRFFLCPKLNFGGLIGKALNKLIEHYAGQKLSQVSFEAEPNFDKKYLLFGEDESAVRRLFSDSLRRRLIEKNCRFQIEGVRDMFIFAKYDFKSCKSNRRLDRERLQATIDDAGALLRLFKEVVYTANEQRVEERAR
jgi:hypothetical protein